MPEPTPAPTEGEATPEGTPLPTAEVSDWGNEQTLEEPNVPKEGAAPKETPPEDPPKEEAPPPAPIVEAVTPDDPGEFEPNDYSFEVTTYDSEGANGKTVKINSIEQWENLMEKDPNLGTGAALTKALRNSTKMEIGFDRDKREFDKKKAEYDQALEENQTREDALTRMSSEIDYLSNKYPSVLPTIPAQYINANWQDPDVAKQPGVKERVELLNYMRDENNRRSRSGLKPMESVLDAFNAFELDQTRKQQTQASEASAQARKDAGARVAGVSPNPVTTAPRGIMVGRAGSLRDMGSGNWNT